MCSNAMTDQHFQFPTPLLAEIIVDMECPAPEWWNAARADREHWPQGIERLLVVPRGCGRIIFRTVDAEEIRAWAQSLPGWHSGGVDASRPLCFYPLDTLDELADALDGGTVDDRVDTSALPVIDGEREALSPCRVADGKAGAA